MGLRVNKENKLPYLRIGTKGWLKNRENEVCQVRCVGIDSRKDEYGRIYLCYTFEVACKNGIERVETSKPYAIFGHTVPSHLAGTIYKHHDDAQKGKSSLNDNIVRAEYLDCNDTVDILEIIEKKYGYIPHCNSYCDYNTFDFPAYKVLADNTIKQEYATFHIKIDKKGFDVAIDEFDNGTLYPSVEIAERHMRKLTTYTFDDEDDESDDEKTEVMEVVVLKISKVDKSKLEELGLI